MSWLAAAVLISAGCGARQDAPVTARDIPGPEPADMITDPTITRAVESRLVLADAVPAHRLTVLTNDGVVTLQGQVDNLRARQAAVELAQGTKGVVSVIDRIEVAPAERPDDEIREDVRAALALNPATNLLDITAGVDNGEVTLVGEVSSWQEKSMAAEAARSVRGVTAINNTLVVAPPAQRSDAEIRHDVRSRLRQDTKVDAALITVSVDEGEVTLSGTVGSALEHARAVEDAQVIGATSVNAQDLVVKWWARDAMRRMTQPAKSDAEVSQAVKLAFLYDPRVASYKPSVTVEDGVVTLTGTVETLEAKRAAQDDAENTLGVERVHNLLQVQPAPAFKAQAVADRVRQVLGWDPVLYRYDLQVSVADGRLHLGGAVPSPYERQLAERLAEKVVGVTRVDNDIRVSTPTDLKSDAELKADITEELFWSPYLDADDITVDVEGGVVTLRGEVASWTERRLAEKNATQAGAEAVNNKLEIAPFRGS